MDARVPFILAWTGVNLAIAAALGSLLSWGGRMNPELPPIEAGKPAPVAFDVIPDYALPRLEQRFRQTLERPLFVPTRRPAPPPPPPPPPPKPTMKKGQFQLMGTMILPEASYVWLRDVESGKTRRVEMGQTINGILIAAVGPERVTMSQYDDEEIVRMKVAPSSVAATAKSSESVRRPRAAPVGEARTAQDPTRAARLQGFDDPVRNAGEPMPAAKTQE